MMFNMHFMPKWRFDVIINSSVDSTKWILKIGKGREPRQKSGLMTKWSKERGVGSFGASASCQLLGGQMS
jgi:hypothetical protein